MVGKSRDVLLVLLTVAALGLVGRADSVDDAEAKKRGVSVETVQLDHAKERIVALETQIEKMKKQLADAAATAKDAAAQANRSKSEAETAKAELAKLQASMTPAQKQKISKIEEQDTLIADGIKSSKLVVGMTLAQANKAMAGAIQEGTVASEGRDGTKTYEWRFYTSTDGGRHAARLAFTISAEVRGGKILSWSRN